MNLTRHHGGIMILLTFAGAMLLTIIPLSDGLRTLRPDWVGLTLIFWCLALPYRVSVTSGFIVGLLLDVLTGTLLGQHALALSLIAFITHKMHQRIRLFPIWQQALTVLILLLIEKLLALWVMGVISQPVPSLSFWAPPFVGMLLWPWVYVILRDLRRRFQVS